MGFTLCNSGVCLGSLPAAGEKKQKQIFHKGLTNRHSFNQQSYCSASRKRIPVKCCQAATQTYQTDASVVESFWTWKGYQTRYQRCGDSGPCVVLVHGFGGNWCGQKFSECIREILEYRKCLPENDLHLGSQFRVFSIDLLGFGMSDKPDPRAEKQNSIYCFKEWGQQVLDFIKEIPKEPSFLICNSIGGVVGLEAGIMDSSQVRGVQLLNVSMRLLHKNNQSPVVRPFVNLLQNALYNTTFGDWFYSQVAKPETVKSILQRAYCDKSTVTDELVDLILTPGMDPRAPPVFLAFVCNSEGPLPNEQLQIISVPVSIVWGEADPWEKVEYGRQLAQLSSVKEYTELPGVGHCPHDEAPDQVNPLVKKFVEQYVDSQS